MSLGEPLAHFFFCSSLLGSWLLRGSLLGGWLFSSSLLSGWLLSSSLLGSWFLCSGLLGSWLLSSSLLGGWLLGGFLGNCHRNAPPGELVNENACVNGRTSFKRAERAR